MSDNGEAALQTGRFADAVRSFSEAVDDDPDDFRGWRGLGLAAHGLGDRAKAMTALHLARRLGGSDAEMILTLTRLEAGRGHWGMALVLSAALPASVAAPLTRQVILAAIAGGRRINDSLTEEERAQAVTATESAVRALAEEERWETVVDACEMVLELAPRAWRLCGELGQARARSGQISLLAAQAEDGVKSLPPLLEALNHFRAGLRAFLKGLEINEEDVGLLATIGHLLDYLGEEGVPFALDVGESCLIRALRIAPDRCSLWSRAANVYYRHHELAAALDVLMGEVPASAWQPDRRDDLDRFATFFLDHADTALATAADGGDRCALAAALSALGFDALAVPLYLQVLRDDPGAEDIRAHLAGIFAAHHQLRDTISVFCRDESLPRPGIVFGRG